MFIQSNEKLLIERLWDRGETEITDLDGPMTLEKAREEFAQDGREFRAFRFSPTDVNVENVTDELAVEIIETDWTIPRHERSMSDTARFI